VVSRYLVIVLAFGTAVLQATRGAWLEAAGLAGLGGGLVLLKLSATRPALRRAAWVAFALTALAMAIVFARRL
jgi:hypothetical protein